MKWKPYPKGMRERINTLEQKVAAATAHARQCASEAIALDAWRRQSQAAGEPEDQGSMGAANDRNVNLCAERLAAYQLSDLNPDAILTAHDAAVHKPLLEASEKRRTCPRCKGTGVYLAYAPTIYCTDSDDEIEAAYQMAERRCPDCEDGS